nr:b3 domain-containing protein [Quercus suber]
MEIVKKEPVEKMTPDSCSHKDKTQEIHGKESKVIKEEHIQSADTNVGDDDKGHIAEKAEPVDPIGVLSQSTPRPTVSCLVATEDQSFLELPTCLPSSNKGRMKMERKVVYLRDSAMRMWPVLYHERPNFKILTSGWEDFRKANLIQPGDECVFSLENDLEAIYGVHIARR